MTRTIVCTVLLLWAWAVVLPAQTISGELKKWHKVTLTFDGPATSETATPNPFLDYRLDVTFSNTDTSYVAPGYFAADGNASETGASAGNKWRVHFAPDAEGTWNYSVSFRTGTNVAVGETTGVPVSFDGMTGSFEIGPTDKMEPDNRARGRLQYVGEHHLRYAETGDYFLKIGADAPENFLAYDDFDNTPDYGGRRKSWGPHVNDWEAGDPVWQGDKGKGIIGAVNYLASEGQNVFSFLTMNINGDDDNVFPYISDGAADRTRMDCSKLDQWEVVFLHADHSGFYLHFKTQETENDQLLDGGELGVERKLYYRELIARFGHHLALNWNMGEENTNTVQQRRDFAQFFYDNDPYRHHVVIHTYPSQIGPVYAGLVGDQSKYTGPSIQTDWSIVHKRTLDWVVNSANSGKKWVVANDEQGSANIGVPHDAYTGTPTQKQIRGSVLWGNIMAGGAGVEYYFGYQLPHSDLTCQDFRSRDQMWDYNRYAHQFFTEHVTFWEMTNQDELVGNPNNNNTQFCLAKPGSEYVIYLFNGGANTDLDLESFSATFYIRWFNPRTGGSLQNGSVTSVTGPGVVNIGQPPAQPDEDWAVLVTVDPTSCAPAGTTCDDGDPSTFNDVEDGACNCEGAPCPAAGTACDDGNPDTINDAQDGFCNCFGFDPDNEIWLEAECAQVGGNWTEETDPDASNGAYLLPPNSSSLNTPPASPADLVTFTVNVSQSGPYKVFARTLVIPGEGNSFWVRANDGDWQKWNAINAGNSGSGYQWDQVGNWTGGSISTPVTFDLTAGMNTVDFSWREPNIRLDKVYVTLVNDSPTTEGPAASNCGDCPPAGTACDDGDPSTFNDVEDGECNCVGTPCPPAGTACDDGDPGTFNDVEDGECNCVGTPCPPAGTACDDGDPSTFNDVEDGECNCVGTPCPPAGTACDDGDPSTFNDVEDGECNCVGTPCPPAGTACDDGDPDTVNDVEDGECNCAGVPSCPPAGTACDDGDPGTFNDVEDGECNCVGTPCPPAGTACDDGDPDTVNDVEDGECNCAGVPSCPPAGTACDDGDPSTFNDVEDGECNCVGTPCPPAGTACDDGDPSTFNDVEDGECNCVGTPCPPAGTACDDGDPSTFNDVEDGECNCVGTPCPPAGTACDDGDPGTFNDVEDGECNCVGTPCPPAGTACDDGDPGTFNDVEDGECNCVGTPCPPAGTACDDGDPGTFNDVEDGECNCVGTPCPPAGTACDDGDPTTFNDQQDGECNCIGFPEEISIMLEAECGLVGDEWNVADDAAASNGAYTRPPDLFSRNEPPAEAKDRVRFEFEIGQAGAYRVFARSMAFDEDSNSYWVRMNDGNWIPWNKVNAGLGDGFAWDQVGLWENGQPTAQPVIFDLEAGPQTLDFAWREPDIRLDKVYVVVEAGTPLGLGEEGANCDPTSAGDVLSGFGWEVFPNPAREEVFVRFSGASVGKGAYLEVLDPLGRILEERRLAPGEMGTVRFDLNGWSPGMYWMRLRRENAPPLTRPFVLSGD